MWNVRRMVLLGFKLIFMSSRGKCCLPKRGERTFPQRVYKLLHRKLLWFHHCVHIPDCFAMCPLSQCKGFLFLQDKPLLPEILLSLQPARRIQSSALFCSNYQLLTHLRINNIGVFSVNSNHCIVFNLVFDLLWTQRRSKQLLPTYNFP